MSARPDEVEVEQPDPPVAIVVFTTDGKSFGWQVDTELSEEIFGPLLRQLADEVEGKNDRAAGAWGR